jgi:heptose I phosphotransferase
MWIASRYREILENAGLAQFDAVMNTQAGRCLRVLADRENWYLQGMYLKKHRACTWATRVAAALGAGSPPSPGRVEAQRALALQSLGIDVMPLMACGEKLHADGRLESFLLSEELAGYCELQDLIQQRFPARDEPSPRPSPSGRGGRGMDPALRRLILQVADIARRFHAAGFNHRDFYCCHFLAKETLPGQFDVRLIDLQRVQQRRWFRRRWIVKDLAQLASMSPDDRVGCREKIVFLRSYLGVRKLRAADKRLVRDVLRKLSLIRRRARHKS